MFVDPSATKMLRLELVEAVTPVVAAALPPENAPPDATKATSVSPSVNKESAPVERTVADCAVPVDVSLYRSPVDLFDAPSVTLSETTEPDVDRSVATDKTNVSAAILLAPAIG